MSAGARLLKNRDGDGSQRALSLTAKRGGRSCRLATVESINADIEKHARIGAIIFSQTPWTIENEILTPTMKIRREQIENTFGEDAERLARDGAEQGAIQLHWFD